MYTDMQTESYEIYTKCACEMAMFYESISFVCKPSLRKVIYMGIFAMGWLNCIAVQAIKETLGVQMTNDAILGKYYLNITHGNFSSDYEYML